MDALPGFAVLGNNRHNVVWCDPHKGIRRQGVLSSSSLCFDESTSAPRKPEAENQTGSGRRASLEKLAPVEGRNLSAGGHRLPSVSRGSFMNRRPDAYIRAASTDVPAHCRVYLIIGRGRRLFQQSNGGHNLSRLAIAALGNIEFLPRFKHSLRH
jgi:hypothetical protein